MSQINKRFIMMCGLPASGKTTWIRNFKEVYEMKGSTNDLAIISTDDIIEGIARQQNLTYNDLFGNITYSFAEKMMYKIAEIQFNKCNCVIWDQTNLTTSSRNKKMEFVPDGWEKVCVYFPTPPEEEHNRRLKRPGKQIPDHVISSMSKQLQEPSLEEGFNKILKMENDYDFINSWYSLADLRTIL